MEANNLCLDESVQISLTVNPTSSINYLCFVIKFFVTQFKQKRTYVNVLLARSFSVFISIANSLQNVLSFCHIQRQTRNSIESLLTNLNCLRHCYLFLHFYFGLILLLLITSTSFFCLLLSMGQFQKIDQIKVEQI